MTTKFNYLISLILLCIQAAFSQVISEITLPNIAGVAQYGQSDSLVVATSSVKSKLYYRFKHDSIWHQISTAPFSYYNALSVDGSTIYAFAYNDTSTQYSGIFRSADLGNTWTQLISTSYIQSHNIYSTNFCSNAYSCFWTDGYDVKRCNYNGLVISVMNQNALLYPSQLDVYNGTLYYSQDNQTSNVIGGSCYTSTGFTNFSGTSHYAVQKPLSYRKQNQIIQFDRATGKLYASSNGGSSFCIFNTGLTNTMNNGYQLKLVASYGHFYMFVTYGNNSYAYYISSINGSPSVWNLFDANCTWTYIPVPSKFTTINPVEILPSGAVLSKTGCLLKYDFVSNTVEPFVEGMDQEIYASDATINNNNDLIVKVNNLMFRKFNSDANYLLLQEDNNPVSNINISNSGIIYWKSNNYSQLSRSMDSCQTFTTIGNIDCSNWIAKNDSLLLITNGLAGVESSMSINGGNSFSLANPVGNTAQFQNNNTDLLASSSSEQSVLLSVANNSGMQLAYTHDFGNTWQSINPSNSNPAFALSFYNADFAIDESNIYYTPPSLFSEDDTIYQISPNGLIYVKQFQNPDSGNVSNRVFWVENGKFYFAFNITLAGQGYFKLYGANGLNSPFTLLYSTPSEFLTTYFYYQVNQGQTKVFCGNLNKLIVFKPDTSNVSTCTGRVYTDLNSNSQYDSGEALQQAVLIHSSNNVSFSNQSGKFLLYNITPNDSIWINSPMYYHSVPAYHIVNSGDTAKNFALVANASINDLSINIIPTTQFRPGFTNNITLKIRNLGTTTAYNAIVKFVQPNLLFNSSTPLINSMNADTLTWMIDSIHAQHERYIHVNDSISTSLPIGSILHLMAEVFTSSTDSTPLNNIVTLDPIVVGSYDPNDKQVEPAMYTTANHDLNEALVYTIRFQNTGTASALNVVVTDTLDSNVDINTIQILSASHNYMVAMKPNRVIEFHFTNINLPDSTSNELLSHGYVQFSIKPDSLWNVGESISNVAYIYFDFNEAVITNTVSNILVSTVGLNQIRTATQVVYPNPFHDYFQIQNKGSYQLELISMQGEIILKKTLVSNDEKISLPELSSGIYVLKLSSKNGEVIIQKVIRH